MSDDKNMPKRIWLQDDMPEATWCSDRINEEDTEYIRANIAEKWALQESAAVEYEIKLHDRLRQAREERERAIELLREISDAAFDSEFSQRLDALLAELEPTKDKE